jgi:hypothetical protein
LIIDGRKLVGPWVIGVREYESGVKGEKSIGLEKGQSSKTHRVKDQKNVGLKVKGEKSVGSKVKNRGQRSKKHWFRKGPKFKNI